MKHELVDNLEFYQQFSSDSVDIIKELNSFLKNPAKHYANDTVDLFLDAVGRALSIKYRVFQINSKGNIIELDIGSVDDYAL